MKTRLDAELVRRGLVSSRSQAENWVKLGKVTVDGKPATKSGQFVREDSDIQLTATEKYVSRAGLKLASVAELLNVSFKNTVVLDVGSSTGGFTDYALQHGAKKVFAVDVGTDHRADHVEVRHVRTLGRARRVRLHRGPCLLIGVEGRVKLEHGDRA